jgi:hypothetical protein
MNSLGELNGMSHAGDRSPVCGKLTKEVDDKDRPKDYMSADQMIDSSEQ